MAIILTADIGGTNCRFGCFELEDGKLALKRLVWTKTRGLARMKDFLEACEAEMGMELRAADALVIAMAGPTDGPLRGKLSNGELELDFSRCPDRYKPARILVINDFIAQAYSVATQCGQGATPVAGPQNVPEKASKGIIGAGTGLGQALLVWPVSQNAPEGQWLALPSENGHAAFPFVNGEEQAFHDFLRRRLALPYATGDDVLTGRGLRCLHLYLSGEDLEPAQIGAEALGSDTETLVWYSRFYGRACRNWMLATLCGGGLWIAGGIAAKNPYCAGNVHFKRELYNAPGWTDFLESIPVRLIEDKNSGLWGAACAGQTLLRD